MLMIREYINPIILIICLFLFLKFFLIPFIIELNYSKKILQDGENTSATITNIENLRSRTNGSIFVKLTLRYQEKDGRTCQSHIKTRISILEIKQFEPGNTIAIRYNKKNPTHIILLKDLPDKLRKKIK